MSASTSFVLRETLLAQLAALPDDLALTAVGQKKAAYLAGWQKQGLSRERLVAEINAGRAIAIGLICGPLSGGVLIVDHDGASAGSLLQELMGGESLPPTWIWSSGRTGRWAAAYRVPERHWPRMTGIWERRTGVASPDDRKVEGLELRWDGHYSVIVGAHPLTDGYSWFPDRSPADLPMAEAPLPLIEALLKKPEPLPPLEQPMQPMPAPSGLRLPLLEFVSLETRQFVESGGVPGQWNDDQLTHTLDLLGAEAWILQQGHIPEPSARDAFADHIAAAIRQDPSFDKRKAWRRYEGALKRDPHPSTPPAKLQERLAWHVNRATGIAKHTAPAPHSPADDGSAAATLASDPGKPRLSPQQKLTALRELAADLLEQSTTFADRVPLLRARAEALHLTLRDQELLRLLWDARRATSGADQLLVPGNRIDFTQTSWVWEGIIMPAAANLLVGLPKTGKTALMLAMLGAWNLG
ncbi:MAG: bifunctional DNA primase/polymerase [Cyanobacteriota bacterium]